ADGQFASQFPVAQNLDAIGPPIGQTGLAQHLDVHAGSILELVERLDIHRQVVSTVASVVETSFRNAPDQRHLTALEADADRTARTGRLPFPTAPAGLAVSAGFALAQPLAAVLGAGTRRQIREAHNTDPAPPGLAD